MKKYIVEELSDDNGRTRFRIKQHYKFWFIKFTLYLRDLDIDHNGNVHSVLTEYRTLEEAERRVNKLRGYTSSQLKHVKDHIV